VNSIGTGADKGFDLQIAFEGLKEEFDLPALLVDFTNGAGGELKMIGEKGLKGLSPRITTF